MDQLQRELTPKDTIPSVNKKQLLILLWLSVVFFASVISGAFILGSNIYGGFTDNDRFIEVKGRADKNISAISASIQIKITSTGDNVENIRKKLEDVSGDVYNFIEKEILTGDDQCRIAESRVELFDKKSDYETTYIDGKEIKTKIDRYSAEKTITLSNVDVMKAKDTKTTIEFDFINNGYSTYTNVDLAYEYPNVNDIKPELLKESLDNARMAAEQFAKDSGQEIGLIKTATQGIVMLEEYGEYETASIVSTVTFYLK